MTPIQGGASCHPGFSFPTGGIGGSGETAPFAVVLAWGMGNVVSCMATSLPLSMQSLLVSIVHRCFSHSHILDSLSSVLFLSHGSCEGSKIRAELYCHLGDVTHSFCHFKLSQQYPQRSQVLKGDFSGETLPVPVPASLLKMFKPLMRGIFSQL